MQTVLDVRGAWHRFGTTVALAGVDLEVAGGECVALLGPNGAGKTTLVNLLTGLLTPGHGRVEVAGGDPRRAATRRRLGVVQQSIGLPRTLTVRELVRGAAVRLGLPADAAGPVLVEVGLARLARRRTSRLSGGEQQRLQLAMALVGSPRLLVLDEPSVGLDVTARQAFWRTLARRRDLGTGVLVTTHLVEEAAAVADRVVVLHRGRVLTADTPQAVSARLPNRTITARTDLDDATLSDLDGLADVERSGAHVRISASDVEGVARRLLAADPDLRDLRIEGASLEQALVSLLADDHEEVAA